MVVERLMHGNLFAATPGFRNLAETAKREIAEGFSEAEVRQRIRSRLDSQGLTLRRQLLPSISRKALRVSLRRFLHALADYFADKAPTHRLGTSLDSLLARTGLDQWAEDAIWTYASTGEVLPTLEGYSGTVWRQDVGSEGDKTPTVWAIATPASDVEALIAWFRDETSKAFPDETFAKRSGKGLEGAEYYRMNQEGQSYSQIASENIYELYPELCASDDDKEFTFYTKLVERETERVKKSAERASARGDRIALYVSPEDKS